MGIEVLVLHGQPFRFAPIACQCGEDVHIPPDAEPDGRMLAAGLRFLDRDVAAELLEARRAFLGEVTFGDFLASVTERVRGRVGRVRARTGSGVGGRGQDGRLGCRLGATGAGNEPAAGHLCRWARPRRIGHNGPRS